MTSESDSKRRRRPARRPARWAVAASAALVVPLVGSTLCGAPAASAAAPITVIAVASQPSQFESSVGGPAADPHLAAAGRFVAFTSSATNLVAGTTTSVERTYVHDLWTDGVTLVSHDAAGNPNSALARASAITSDGEFVVFVSTAKLVPADTNAFADVYIWTRKTDTVDLVSKNSSGGAADGDSGYVFSDPTAAVSDDGRYVAFASQATNLNFGADSNGKADVFRRDRTAGTTTKVSLNGALALNGDSYAPDMSADGRYVVWGTNATNLPGTDTNGGGDIWLRDLNDLTLAKMSIGTDADANGSSLRPKVSNNGNLVVFDSTASDLVAGDTNAKRDAFLRNRSASTTTRISVHDSTGAQLSEGGSYPDLSPNNSSIAFMTASPAQAADTNGISDIYLRTGSATTLQSVSATGEISSQTSNIPSVSDDAVAWTSTEHFATTDTNSSDDVYVRHQPFFSVFTTIESFVSKQYERFHGTVPTQQQIDDEAKLLRAGASPFHFIIQLTDEASFSAKRAPVIRLYWAYFKRRPDLSGLNFWLNRYKNGARLVDISQQFAKSSEFKTKYGNTTPEQFVTLVYQNVLEREPESGGLAYWAAKIKKGTPRGQVMTNFSESSEGKRVIGPRSDTILVALGMYGKIPSQPLFDAAVADRQAGFPREILVAYILGAPEYITTII